jgi:uncharacterized protein
MTRPRKRCICRLACEGWLFKPAGAPSCRLGITVLSAEEMEALHLCDAEGLTQEQAGSCMGVSRGTVQRLLSAARRKVASTLAGRQALLVGRKGNANEDSGTSG